MALIRRPRRYDRTRFLQEASRARARGRRRKAVALLRRVLAVEPGNAELHARLAPLLAERRLRFDAWQSFKAAADAFLREGREDRALGVLREAARLLPRKLDAWLEIAALQQARERPAEAVQTLLEARQRFRRRRERSKAIFLLRRALALDPDEPAIALELARLLARSEQPEEALLLLDRLEARVEARPEGAPPEVLRRVRRARFRITRSLRDGWRWLATRRSPEPEPAGLPARRSARGL